jgi:hypothetical protein
MVRMDSQEPDKAMTDRSNKRGLIYFIAGFIPMVIAAWLPQAGLRGQFRNTPPATERLDQ